MSRLKSAADHPNTAIAAIVSPLFQFGSFVLTLKATLTFDILICGLALGMNMKSKLLSKKEESIAEKVVDEAFTVYKVSGPALLERVYEVCFFLTFVVKCLGGGTIT